MHRILVVDDDIDILEAVQIMLEQAGYEVFITPRGEEAFSQSDEYKPELILLDVLLSGKDGRVICRELKNQEKTKHIPIIMFSAHPDAKYSTIEAGADDFISKPFNMDELLNKIETHTSN